MFSGTCAYEYAHESSHPKGVINMASVQEVDECASSAGHDYCFEIICAQRTYHMSAPSEDTRADWIAALA